MWSPSGHIQEIKKVKMERENNRETLKLSLRGKWSRQCDIGLVVYFFNSVVHSFAGFREQSPANDFYFPKNKEPRCFLGKAG